MVHRRHQQRARALLRIEFSMAARVATRYAHTVQNRPTETELKIPVAGLAPVREMLSASGGQQQHSAAREENILLDTDDRRIASKSGVLRLRRHGSRRMLTLKGAPTYRGAIKERTEHELEISDLETMQVILEQLGYHVVARYEKDRESWKIGKVMVELDHTPMGDFVELEGPPGELEVTAHSIGLDPNQAVRGSYLSLWLDFRSRSGDDDLPVDMVFGR